MNVHFPGEGERVTFFGILGLMAVVLTALVIVLPAARLAVARAPGRGELAPA